MRRDRFLALAIDQLKEGMMTSPVLQEKHAVVFGAGGSIGAAVAKEFAAEGALPSARA